MTGSWTDRYTGARVPPCPLRLAPPLRRAWKGEGLGEALGFVRVGDGAVFTTVGAGVAQRLNLESGETIWKGTAITGLVASWDNDVIVSDDNHQLWRLDARSGAVKSVRVCPAGLGLRDSFVVNDILVGSLADKFHAINLRTLEPLWEVPQAPANALVGDEKRVIRADHDVTCYDLNTGAVRWHRPGSDFGGKAWQMGFLWGELFVVRIGQPLLLTALSAATGRTAWRTEFPVSWCEPYGNRVFGVTPRGLYQIADLETGRVLRSRQLSDVPLPMGPKSGLAVATASAWPWRDAVLSVSETHVFVQRPAGQIVVLERETGEVEQIVELDGMPASHSVVYEGRLLLTDFAAAVYCFAGAGLESTA